jgi:PAS domain-containing protein
MENEKSTEAMNPPADLADAVLSAVSEAIIAANRTGVIKLRNPRAVRIVGFTVEKTLGQPLDFIFSKNLRACHWNGYHSVMETGESHYGPR